MDESVIVLRNFLYVLYYMQVCETVPVYVTKKAKETECQKCRRFYETVPTTKWVKECHPVRGDTWFIS